VKIIYKQKQIFKIKYNAPSTFLILFCLYLLVPSKRRRILFCCWILSGWLLRMDIFCVLLYWLWNWENVEVESGNSFKKGKVFV